MVIDSTLELKRSGMLNGISTKSLKETFVDGRRGIRSDERFDASTMSNDHWTIGPMCWKFRSSGNVAAGFVVCFFHVRHDRPDLADSASQLSPDGTRSAGRISGLRNVSLTANQFGCPAADDD